MLKGIDINQRVEFTSKEDKDDPKTIFVFKPLSGADMLDLSKFIEDGHLVLSGENILNMLEKSIVEIQNSGYEDKTVRQILSSYDVNVLTELLDEANKLNRLSPEEEKN